MPRAVASVLMRLLGQEGLWALPGGRGTDTPRRSTLPGHSQLNLPLLKLLQNCPPPARPEAGGELGHRHPPEGLDQQEEPVWEKPWSGLEPASLLPDPQPGPHLWEFSRELVKQRTLEKFMSRMRCRTTSGLARRLQGT